MFLLLSNPTLADDFDNGNISTSSTFEYNYFVEYNHNTQEHDLSISEGETLIDVYTYNTKSDALSDIKLLESLGVNISKTNQPCPK